MQSASKGADSGASMIFSPCSVTSAASAQSEHQGPSRLLRGKKLRNRSKAMKGRPMPPYPRKTDWWIASRIACLLASSAITIAILMEVVDLLR